MARSLRKSVVGFVSRKVKLKSNVGGGRWHNAQPNSRGENEANQGARKKQKKGIVVAHLHETLQTRQKKTNRGEAEVHFQQNSRLKETRKGGECLGIDGNLPYSPNFGAKSKAGPFG